jgi:hypothetical protein
MSPPVVNLDAEVIVLWRPRQGKEARSLFHVRQTNAVDKSKNSAHLGRTTMIPLEKGQATVR